MRRSEVAAQLQEAIRLAQAGQRAEARSLLDAIVQADPQQELAWLWLASVATDRDERIKFLARTLALNPDNARAQAAYTRLTGAVFTPPAAPDGPRDGAGDVSLLRRVQRLAPSTANLLLAVALVIVVIAGVLLGLDILGGGDDEGAILPSATPRPPTVTPGPSPTPTWTPLPTVTPGPSPTSLWNAPLPTWTPPPTWTPAPVLAETPAPAERPTRTPVPEPADSTLDGDSDGAE